VTSPRVKRDGERILDRGQPEVDDAEDLRAFSQSLPMTTVPAPSVEGVYVLRVPAEREVQQYLASAPAQMLLVVGPKGSGKSTPVQHALAGRPGTVAIEFSDDMVATQMYRAIAKRVCPGKPALHERASEKTVLVALL